MWRSSSMRYAQPSRSSRCPEVSSTPRLALLRAALICAAALAAVAPSRADDRIVIQGQVAAETWQTGDQSPLLTRNQGEAAAQGRLRLWLAGQIAPGLQGMALGRFEDGQADEYITPEASHTELEQAWLRWTLPTSFRLVAQGGQMSLPIGGFS